MGYNGIQLPRGAWDSHIHVLDKIRFPMIDERPFTPKQATYDDCVKFMAPFGIEHVCIVASSIYGPNNECLVDSLKQYKGKARGIAYIKPEQISDAELNELHAAGVRGVRVNLWSRSQTMSPDDWRPTLESYARRLRRLNWVIQIFVSMDQIETLAPVVAEGLGVKVVFDHLGCPNQGSIPVAEQPGCAELYKLLEERDDVYIKMSGWYRFQGVIGLDEHMKNLLDIAPNQVVWASDWPHTGGMKRNPGGDPHAEQDFLTVDVPEFLQCCLALTKGDSQLMQKVWVDNPRTLWDYQDGD